MFLIGIILSSICTSSSWIAPSLTTGLRFNLIDSSVMKTDQVCTFSCGCSGTLKLSKYMLKVTARPFSNTTTGSSQEQLQILSASIQFFNYPSSICISGWSCGFNGFKWFDLSHTYRQAQKSGPWTYRV